jgi:predicted nucleic-acid-binding protein
LIGLDTNVLVRFLTQDDERQAGLVDDLVAQAIEDGEVLFVDDVVLCELVWVLRFSYRFDRETVASTLEQLLGTALFSFEDRDLLLRALAVYREGSADFADHVIGFRNGRAGCDSTMTFDQALRESASFSLL